MLRAARPLSQPIPAGAQRPLRILNVVPTYYPAVRYGGTIRVVHGLAAALAQRGHDVHVYTTTMDGAGDLAIPIGQDQRLDDVHVWYFPVPRFRRLCVAPALAEWFRQEVSRFDVVHLHSVFLWPTWVAARAASRANVPYVITPHGMLLREAINGRNRWIKTGWINCIEKRTLARASAVHATAGLESRELKALGTRLQEVVTLPCGVDWPSSHRPLMQTPYTGLPPRFALFLSRINWKKGLDRLIAAWQWVPDLPLVIAGNDEEGYQPKLEALARALGVAARIHFIGPVADVDKWGLYEAAELFVLPSYSENFGVVVIEAMAMGCPVIVTPDVGASEVVAESQGGVITANEPATLAAAVRALAADREGRHACSRRGQAFVRDRLSWGGIAARFEDLYRSVAAARRVSRTAA
jgi:glycosyltransferase involved in cell wall biosynthesis